MITICFLVSAECPKNDFITKVEALRDYLIDTDYEYKYGPFIVNSEHITQDEAVKIFNQFIRDVEDNAIDNEEELGEVEFPNMEKYFKGGGEEYVDIEDGNIEFSDSFCLVHSYGNKAEFLSVKLSNPNDYVDDFEEHFQNKNLGIRVDMKDDEFTYRECEI